MATLPQAVRPSAPGAAVLAAQPPGRTAPERGPVRLPGPDRSAATGPRSAVRSWPLLVLAAPAAAEVWSGWVGIAARTGFGLISPLPGIWPSLHIDTTITLPVGVEAYAAYALRAWLAPPAPSASGHAASPGSPRSSPSRSAAPGRSPTTCWSRQG
jgi:hypothetical protein